MLDCSQGGEEKRKKEKGKRKKGERMLPFCFELGRRPIGRARGGGGEGKGKESPSPSLLEWRRKREKGGKAMLAVFHGLQYGGE